MPQSLAVPKAALYRCQVPGPLENSGGGRGRAIGCLAVGYQTELATSYVQRRSTVSRTAPRRPRWSRSGEPSCSAAQLADKAPSGFELADRRRAPNGCFVFIRRLAEPSLFVREPDVRFVKDFGANGIQRLGGLGNQLETVPLPLVRLRRDVHLLDVGVKDQPQHRPARSKLNGFRVATAQ